MNEKLVEAVAAALGFTGAHRVVGGERMFVLDRASTMKWGESIFDPLNNGEHSFLLAGLVELAFAFGTSYAIARPHAVAGPAVTEMYNKHEGDRFAAARFAIATCVMRIAELKRVATLAPRGMWNAHE